MTKFSFQDDHSESNTRVTFAEIKATKTHDR